MLPAVRIACEVRQSDVEIGVVGVDDLHPVDDPRTVVPRFHRVGDLRHAFRARIPVAHRKNWRLSKAAGA